MSIQMTREEYQNKYGVQAPVSSSAPIKMTRAEYEAKYGAQPIQQVPFPQPTDTLGGDLSTRLGTVQKAFGQAYSAPSGLEAGLQAARIPLRVAGQVAGGVVDVLGRIVQPALEFTGLDKPLGRAVSAITETPGAKAISRAYSKIPTPIKESFEDVTNVATLFPIGVGAKVAKKAIEPLAKESGVLFDKALTSKKSRDVDNLLRSTKSINTATQELTKRNVKVAEILGDDAVFRGLNVVDGKIIPDKAIEVIQKRVDDVMDVTREILPEVDKYAPRITKEQFRNKAISELTDGILPTERLSIIKGIDDQLATLPDDFLPSDIDKIRAQARNSGRDAKGRLVRDSEFGALENAARDLMFSSADKLPTAIGGEFAQLRQFVTDNIAVEKLLDKSIRNQTVKGGRLGAYSGRALGGLFGVGLGPLGVAGGIAVGDRIASILVNKQLGNSIKMKFIKKATDDPAIIEKARMFLERQRGYEPLQLPAPETPFRTQTVGGRTIPLSKEAQSTIEARERMINR